MARDSSQKKNRNNAGKNCYRLSATVVPQLSGDGARGGREERSNAMSWLEWQHMCRYWDIYFIQLATLLSTLPLSHSFYPLSLSLFALSLPLFSALPSHIFRRPFDAFYFKAQRHRHIPLERPEPRRAAPRARPSAKSFDWLFLWSLSLSRPGHNLLEKSLCKNRNRPKAQGEITFTSPPLPPSLSLSISFSRSVPLRYLTNC